MANSPLTPTTPPPHTPLCEHVQSDQDYKTDTAPSLVPISSHSPPAHVPPPHTPPHKATTTTASHTRERSCHRRRRASDDSHAAGSSAGHLCTADAPPTKKFGLKMFEPYASAHIAIYRVSFATPKTGVFLTLTISTTQISIYDNVIISVELVTKPTTPPHPPTKHAYQ